MQQLQHVRPHKLNSCPPINNNGAGGGLILTFGACTACARVAVVSLSLSITNLAVICAEIGALIK